MGYSLRKLVVNAITDTPLEHILRTTYTRLTPTRNNKYDRQLTKLMRRALSSHSQLRRRRLLPGRSPPGHDKIVPQWFPFCF